MLISEVERDALNEIINIGFGRAANALSMLVDQRILIDAPQANIFPLADLPGAMSQMVKGNLINVHQVFRGKLSGDAMLLMDVDSATVLVDLLEGGNGKARSLTASDREALVEAGNILLNAFIGSFGNLLKVHITFTVPHFNLESLKDLLTTLGDGIQELEYALLLKIHFRLVRGDVSGYVMIVMGIQSLQVLLNTMHSEGYVTTE